MSTGVELDLSSDKEQEEVTAGTSSCQAGAEEDPRCRERSFLYQMACCYFSFRYSDYSFFLFIITEGFEGSAGGAFGGFTISLINN